MRFLVDESLSARVASLLRTSGHDAVHVGDRDLLGARDDAVMAAAAQERRVVLSADTDFGELLALGRHPGPSVVIFRRAPRRPESQVSILLASLPDTEQELTRGAILVLTPGHARLRLLPVEEAVEEPME